MNSKISGQLKEDLIERCKAMTPLQRLDAFVAHCQRVAEFKNAGLANIDSAQSARSRDKRDRSK